MDLDVQDLLGYHFIDATILQECLRTPSYAHDKHILSNDRLEFLGDSLIGLFVAKMLFEESNLTSHDMTELRKKCVNNKKLAEIAVKLGLAKQLDENKFSSEFIMTSKKQPIVVKMLADILEAIVAAIYIDGGIEVAHEFFNNKLKQYL